MTSLPTAPLDFAPLFSSRQVLTGELDHMRAIRRLRYQVYCIDCSFLPPADYPLGEESDEHDERSAHFCAFNLQQELVGYVRLVLPDSQGRLPFQGRSLEPAESLPGASAVAGGSSTHAEVSRLMVRQDYRRRRGDLLSGVAVPPEAAAEEAPQRRNPSPQIMLSLYRCLYVHSLKHGLGHWYAAMERPLARVLTQMGFGFRQVGPVIDYFGPVAPYHADLEVLRTQVQMRHPELLRWLAGGEAG